MSNTLTIRAGMKRIKSVAMKAALGLVLAAIPLMVLAFLLWPSKPAYSEEAEAPILKSDSGVAVGPAIATLAFGRQQAHQKL
jgi:hypothetical protein